MPGTRCNPQGGQLTPPLKSPNLVVSGRQCNWAKFVPLLMLLLVFTGCQGFSAKPNQGTGPAQSQLAVSPASLNFGNVVDGTSASLSANLNATGNTVTVFSASSTSSEFVVSGISFPAAIGAGQTLPFTVTFTPQASGTASATLSVVSNASNSPAQQSLTGDGTAPASHSVDLLWNASTSPDVVGYNIYRGGISGGPYSAINTVLDASVTYTDSFVNAGQSYYYVVTAVDGSGLESGYSNEAKAVIPSP